MIKEFIQEYKKEILKGLLIFLITTLSFGLGYLFNLDNNRAPIIIEKCSNATAMFDIR